MNLVGRVIYTLLGVILCSGLILVIDTFESRGTIITDNYSLEPSEVSCPKPKAVKCDLTDLDYRLYDMELQISALRNYSHYEQELQEFQFLQMVINKFYESHDYDIDDYNCQHYARDLRFVYESLGYDINYIGGYNDEVGHMWNELTIEIDGTGNKVGYFLDDYEFSYKPKMLNNLKVIRGN